MIEQLTKGGVALKMSEKTRKIMGDAWRKALAKTRETIEKKLSEMSDEDIRGMIEVAEIDVGAPTAVERMIINIGRRILEGRKQ